MTPEDFIAAVVPGAKAARVAHGIPASITIAQAILESGWGKSGLALQANNLFGIKSSPSWHGPTITMPTKEFLKGVWVIVPAIWRKYPSYEESINDHAAFLLGNTRYAKAFDSTDPATFIRAVWQAGYSTDPTYPDKIMQEIAARKLSQYD